MSAVVGGHHQDTLSRVRAGRPDVYPIQVPMRMVAFGCHFPRADGCTRLCKPRYLRIAAVRPGCSEGPLPANSVEKLKVFAALYVRRMCSRLCFTLPLWLELALEPTWLAF